MSAPAGAPNIASSQARDHATLTPIAGDPDPEGGDCVACGRCCHHGPSTVHLLLEDDARMGPDLLAAYTVLDARPPGFRFMKNDGTACAGLDRATPGHFPCKVYAVRPTDCRIVEPGSPCCLEARRLGHLGTSVEFKRPARGCLIVEDEVRMPTEPTVDADDKPPFRESVEVLLSMWKGGEYKNPADAVQDCKALLYAVPAEHEGVRPELEAILAEAVLRVDRANAAAAAAFAKRSGSTRSAAGKPAKAKPLAKAKGKARVTEAAAPKKATPAKRATKAVWKKPAPKRAKRAAPKKAAAKRAPGKKKTKKKR